MLGGTVSVIAGGKFANGAVTAAFIAAFSAAGAASADAQERAKQGENSEVTDDQIKAQAKIVRGSLGRGRALASEKLAGYCAAQPNSCSGFAVADFDGLNFRWERDLFFPGENSKSVGFTGGYVDRSTSPVTIRLYAGGIALQGNGTGADATAAVLLHEFWHTTPQGTAMFFQYIQSGTSLPYLQRPYEIDAFRFSKEVMQYAPGH